MAKVAREISSGLGTKLLWGRVASCGGRVKRSILSSTSGERKAWRTDSRLRGWVGNDESEPGERADSCFPERFDAERSMSGELLALTWALP